MLCRRVVRFDPDQYRLREGVSGLAAPFEHEDEHEGRGRFIREAKLLECRGNSATAEDAIPSVRSSAASA
jgi:hypothetical protein